jgi:hypothetical protein
MKGMRGSTVGDNCENYHMVGEQMQTANLSVNNFTHTNTHQNQKGEGANLFMDILPENSTFLATE